ncbi:MAG: hypothetical protein ACREV7_22295 [Steroidobacteraceae bacterium]
MSRTEREQPQDLVRLRRRLDEHRRGSRPGKALPGWVWAAAGRLARRHGVHRTARALGLEYNKLKRAGGAPAAIEAAGSRQRPSAGAVKFLELTSGLGPAGPACRLRLAGPGGQHLELEMAPGAAKEVVLELCREGWGAQP